ncbi:hypothetical protein [Sporisorium scitamineum]|uniref:Uncharacterized protein n=1 Tax=Sporisorium scitamineum TaxID=49012 RepID=A0A0F7SCM2_9BASI|nr:hypothetical protein [Sporisorium scitamineum]
MLHLWFKDGDSNLDLQHAHANHYATKPFFYKTPTSVLAKSIQLA